MNSTYTQLVKNLEYLKMKQMVNHLDEMLDFISSRFIEAKENIVFLGSSGVGKTHLATSIGIAVTKQCYRTYFIKCNDLLQQLKKAKLENRLDARLKYINKYKLLIIDKLGYLPIDTEDSKLFFQLVDMRIKVQYQ